MARLAAEMPVPPPESAPEPAPAEAVAFLDCLFGRCRFPLDLSLESDAGPLMPCCGAPAEPGRSYCGPCALRAAGAAGERRALRWGL